MGFIKVIILIFFIGFAVLNLYGLPNIKNNNPDKEELKKSLCVLTSILSFFSGILLVWIINSFGLIKLMLFIVCVVCSILLFYIYHK